MIDLDYWKNKSQSEILAEIRNKSALIVQQQKVADSKGFSDYGGAIGLQRLRKERDALRSLLNPLTIVE